MPSLDGPRALRPMKTVTGGVVKLDNIIGRAHETRAILSSLSTGGIILVGDRRHGKTSLMSLAAHETRAAGHPTIQMSAERKTYEDFAHSLANALGQLDSSVAREVKRWKVAFDAKLVKAERAPAPERDLDELIRLAIPKDKEQILVLFIDEITVLAKDLEDAEPGAGKTFLHTLRRLRQEHPHQLATVLSGSIGFHHVAQDAMVTVNDIPKLLVGPIAGEDAAWLAGCLLLGEGVPAQEGVANAIAAAAEHIPYYVQLLVAAARDDAEATRSRIGPSDIPPLLEASITDVHDPWDLRHYRNRLPDYYGSQALLAKALLDVYASSGPALNVADAGQVLSSASDFTPDKDTLVELIERLEQDHYLRRQGNADRFASELLRRAWVAMRR